MSLEMRQLKSISYIIMERIILCFLIIVTLSCNDFLSDPENVDEQNSESKSPPIEFVYPIPSKAQLDWQNAELLLFIHFGMNTFTDTELGSGKESTTYFNPKRLDANQWLSIAKEVGFKYVILTAKHVDGFCLWPSRYTDHSVKNSPYKNGQGDIVREFVDACQEYGIAYGFYLAPWDRHENSYGTSSYNSFYRNQLIELLSNYGKVSEVWMDGENDGTVHQDYDWDLFHSTIRWYQPDALIAIRGPDIRWIGNENGFANKKEWCVQPKSFTIQQEYNGNVWYPSECDVSIRPGWFYHKSEDYYSIKSVDELIEIYFKSVGRNSNLLLNVPPNKDGLFSIRDISRLREWRVKLNEIFQNNICLEAELQSTETRFDSVDYSLSNCIDNNRNTFWVTEKGINTAEIILTFKVEETFNILKLEEAIDYGQRIYSFAVYEDANGTWKHLLDGTTIGRTRLLRFEPVTTRRIKIKIIGSYGSPTIREIGAYSYSF